MSASTPVLLAIHALSSFAPVQAQAQDSARARELFLKNCASCHGETGDGKGTAQLDRPARSFKDGGFSFGNTPEQLFKTISTGIPGSPMAGFDASLSEEERKVLARYVVTLGPPVEEVKAEDTILTVRDRPLVVRGMLPPLAEGLPTHPRGLLIGDPSGITFEYSVDDVRLLALRQGGFVERTDWSGLGGTPLEPLGKVVYMVEEEARVALPPGRRRDSAAGATLRHAWTARSCRLPPRPGRSRVARRRDASVGTMPFGTGYLRASSSSPVGRARSSR
jgi:mono/diheme cytochrome c family protein